MKERCAMSTLKKTLILGTTSALALSGMASGIAVAAPAEEDVPAGSAVAADAGAETYYKTDIVTLDVVPGEFSYTQDEIDPTSVIKAIADASSYLCNDQGHMAKDDSTLAEDWSIDVVGKVKNPQAFTFQELIDSDAGQKLKMGCTCMGNPADGRMSANAEVTGIPVSVFLQNTGIEEGANTIVFTSADGYQVALPLTYVIQRYCPIVFDINGAPIAEVVGGSNQLWLGATSANYFARDIVTIELEERQTPPPSPSSDEAREAYQNLPNIGVLLGGEIR